ncbi:hypothetical protein, partial [Mesorhizobium sp.]|uniref:hypothetical protein n=1 Tax=Mesorhizobium sp. TaxID=1871066 RepID=UPI00345CFEC3
MNDAAAGAAAQPVDRSCELLRLGSGIARNPGRLQKIVGAIGAIIGIDDGSGQNLDLAAERELDKIGDA